MTSTVTSITCIVVMALLEVGLVSPHNANLMFTDWDGVNQMAVNKPALIHCDHVNIVFCLCDDVTSCHVCMVVNISSYSAKIIFLILKATSISALFDTCTLLFPQLGDSPLHLAACLGYFNTVNPLTANGAFRRHN